MNYCKHIKGLFQDYLADNLLHKTKNEVEEHLRNCQNCKKEFTAIKLVEDTIKGLQVSADKKVPAGLRTRILANIKILTEKHRPFFYIPSFVRILCFSAVFVVLVVSTVHFCPRRTTTKCTANNFIAQAIAQAREDYESEFLAQKTTRVLGEGGQR
ncbi:MAG: zf-HC2 domain-containing protein [Elusimicrobiota bacterium]